MREKVPATEAKFFSTERQTKPEGVALVEPPPPPAKPRKAEKPRIEEAATPPTAKIENQRFARLSKAKAKRRASAKKASETRARNRKR